MGILYTCDDCGKEFNLQIKLKKHMQSAHVSQKDLKPSDYLDEEIEFTNDEKAYYFDDLQTKYDELRSKVEFFEKRYEILKPKNKQNVELSNKVLNAQVQANVNPSTKVKRERKNFDEYLKDSSPDPYMPEGWRSGSMRGIADSKLNVFEAPDGRFCSSRRLAILHAKKVFNPPERDILLMRKGLIEKDGWTASDKLPDKWLLKESFPKSGRSVSFMNHDYVLLSTGVKALQELIRMEYSERQINLFINGFIDPSIKPDEIIWESDSVIPKPWKIGKTLSRGLFITPTGILIRQKLKFVEIVKSSNDYAKSTILSYVRKNFKKKNFINQETTKKVKQNEQTLDIWSREVTLDLPNGWRSGKDCEQRKFFNKEGKAFCGLEAVRYMISNNYPEEDIEKLKYIAVRDGSWTTREFLPLGWRSKHYTSGSRKFLTPTFKVLNFEGAIKQMKVEGINESDILKFKKGCDWDEHEDLPEGWLHSLRTEGEKFHYRSFLSPNGRTINGTSMLLKHFMSMDYVDEKEMEKVHKIIEQDGWKRVNGIPEGWLYKEKLWAKGMIKKHFMSEKGDRFKTSRDALKYLLANNYPQNDVYKFRKTFNPTLRKEKKDTVVVPSNINIKEESIKDVEKRKTRPEQQKKVKSKVELKKETLKYAKKDFLPEGWVTNGRYYRSPDGKTFETLHETVKALKSKGFSDNEIDKVKMNGSQIKFMKKSSLPPGWMCAKIESGEMRGGSITSTRFLSADGRIFMSRALTIKFMIENDYPKSDVELMKSLLISEDNWETDPVLPNGWMTRQNKACGVVFLSPTWETIKHKSNVLDYMKKNNYTDAVIAKAKQYLFENPKFIFSNKRIKHEPDNGEEELMPPKKKAHLDSEVIEWKSGDSSLPENWLIARNSDNSVLISSPKGEKFSSRIEAIASLIKNQQSPDDIFRMWSNLHLEGWVCDEDNLPSGWRRKYQEELRTYHYLSPLMDVIKTPGSLLKHMELSPDYSAEDIVKVKFWIKSL